MAVSCYLNPNKILLGQDKEFAKNARVFIDREQPLIPAVSIKEEDIKMQEAKLKEMRKQLQIALEDFENMDIEDYLSLNDSKSGLGLVDGDDLVKASVKKQKIDHHVQHNDDDEIIIEDDDVSVAKVEPKAECIVAN